jgi:hypothetical protein
MNSELILPKGFPSALAARAFRVGNVDWPTWSIADGLEAISAFQSMSLAITGGDLAVRTPAGTQTHYTTAKGNYVYCFNIEPDPNEDWTESVRRSCDEASAHLADFTPHYPIVDPAPYTVGFSLMWESKAEHDEALTFRANEVEASSSINPQATLAEALHRFRTWAANGHEGSYGEWECDYDHWQEIYGALGRALDETQLQATIEDILYALARDHEIEEIRCCLTARADVLMWLAPAALVSPERDARWQIAVSLGEVGSPAALNLLRRFVDDSDEYVRRRALMAHASHRPREAEPIAWAWLSSTEPYSRLAALHVLRDIQSSRLSDAIQMLRDDPFEVVRQRAVEFSQPQGPDTGNRNA